MSEEDHKARQDMLLRGKRKLGVMLECFPLCDDNNSNMPCKTSNNDIIWGKVEDFPELEEEKIND